MLKPLNLMMDTFVYVTNCTQVAAGLRNLQVPHHCVMNHLVQLQDCQYQVLMSINDCFVTRHQICAQRF